MQEKSLIKLAENCGMTLSGYEDGEPQFLGTIAQWEEFERQQDILEEQFENESNILIENQ